MLLFAVGPTFVIDNDFPYISKVTTNSGDWEQVRPAGTIPNQGTRLLCQSTLSTALPSIARELKRLALYSEPNLKALAVRGHHITHSFQKQLYEINKRYPHQPQHE